MEAVGDGCLDTIIEVHICSRCAAENGSADAWSVLDKGRSTGKGAGAYVMLRTRVCALGELKISDVYAFNFNASLTNPVPATTVHKHCARQ